MNKLLNFNNFIQEKYLLDQNDPPEITSQKRGFNDLEAQITEYQNKKVTLDNIYKSYVDDKDLMNRLKAQKFLEGNPSNVKTIKFTNPLLAIHAQISRKLREVMDIQNMIKSDQKTISDKEKMASGGQDVKAAYEQEIEATEQKIGDQNGKIQKLNTEILMLKKQIDAQINKMKKDLIESQRRINYEQAT